MPVITTIQDLKEIYQRRVPRMFYDYCESGSWTEQTFRENTSDFGRLRLRQKVAVDMLGRRTDGTTRYEPAGSRWHASSAAARHGTAPGAKPADAHAPGSTRHQP